MVAGSVQCIQILTLWHMLDLQQGRFRISRWFSPTWPSVWRQKIKMASPVCLSRLDYLSDIFFVLLGSLIKMSNATWPQTQKIILFMKNLFWVRAKSSGGHAVVSLIIWERSYWICLLRSMHYKWEPRARTRDAATPHTRQLHPHTPTPPWPHIQLHPLPNTVYIKGA